MCCWLCPKLELSVPPLFAERLQKHDQSRSPPLPRLRRYLHLLESRCGSRRSRIHQRLWCVQSDTKAPHLGDLATHECLRDLRWRRLRRPPSTQACARNALGHWMSFSRKEENKKTLLHSLTNTSLLPHFSPLHLPAAFWCLKAINTWLINKRWAPTSQNLFCSWWWCPDRMRRRTGEFSLERKIVAVPFVCLNALLNNALR